MDSTSPDRPVTPSEPAAVSSTAEANLSAGSNPRARAAWFRPACMPAGVFEAVEHRDQAEDTSFDRCGRILADGLQDPPCLMVAVEEHGPVRGGVGPAGQQVGNERVDGNVLFGSVGDPSEIRHGRTVRGEHVRGHHGTRRVRRVSQVDRDDGQRMPVESGFGEVVPVHELAPFIGAGRPLGAACGPAAGDHVMPVVVVGELNHMVE